MGAMFAVGWLGADDYWCFEPAALCSDSQGMGSYKQQVQLHTCCFLTLQYYLRFTQLSHARFDLYSSAAFPFNATP